MFHMSLTRNKYARYSNLLNQIYKLCYNNETVAAKFKYCKRVQCKLFFLPGKRDSFGNKTIESLMHCKKVTY